MIDIINQDKIKTYFDNAISNNKISHAYIISGDKGSGKKLVSKYFIQKLFCKTHTLCGECSACKQVLQGTNIDIKYITHEKEDIISVKEVRKQICDDAVIRPYQSDYKVYVVDEAQKLRVQAQNALLKTIEEPAKYVIILLLTTNTDAFLDTIKSRCVELETNLLSDYIIKNYIIKNYDIDYEKAEKISEYSNGKLGMAISMIEDKTIYEKHLYYTQILKDIEQVGKSKLLEYKKNIKDTEILDFLFICNNWYRDILVTKKTKDKKLLIYKSYYEYILAQSKYYSYLEINNIFELIEKTKDRINANVNKDFAFDVFLDSLKIR